MEFACSPPACVGFIWVLWFPPTIKTCGGMISRSGSGRTLYSDLAIMLYDSLYNYNKVALPLNILFIRLKVQKKSNFPVNIRCPPKPAGCHELVLIFIYQSKFSGKPHFVLGLCKVNLCDPAYCCEQTGHSEGSTD